MAINHAPLPLVRLNPLRMDPVVRLVSGALRERRVEVDVLGRGEDAR